jgi:DNA modification methylase
MTLRLLTGDARDVLPTLPSNSVHTVVTSPPYYGLRSYLDVEHPDKHRELGSEASPDEYLANMIAVFREVRRVLRRDGTCWINMGDSYASTANGRSAADTKAAGNDDRTFRDKPFSTVGNGYKAKDLMLMSARLALALQADGWWVRSDIIWAKPNPMPESCTDRPTSAHEHVFMLTKAARYFYDADAVREPELNPGASLRQIEYQQRLRNERLKPDGVNHSLQWRGGADSYQGGRNLRNVWTIATAPFSEAHFATFPPALVERCIRAGTSERGCCAACGAPWVRQISVDYRKTRPSAGNDARSRGEDKFSIANGGSGYRGCNLLREVETTGWRAGCQCNADVAPCTVLDPFLGSGTTALVADRLQRHCIGIDLSLTYADMAQRRLEADCPLFTSWAPAEDPEDERMRDLFAEAAE